MMEQGLSEPELDGAATPERRDPIALRWLDSTIWDEIVLDPGDIVIATYPKSGTTWMQQIVSRILQQQSDDLDLWRASPWMEAPRPNDEKRHWIAKRDGPRFLKSHLPMGILPYDPAVKYINVARDGPDMILSRYQMQMRIMKRAGATQLPVARDYFHQWLEDDPWRLPYFDHILSWWRVRKLPNVKLTHYAALKRDLGQVMRSVADFLDVEVVEQCWDDNVQRCTFAHMKTNASTLIATGDKYTPGASQHFFDKGESGRAREHLTADDIRKYRERALSVLGKECAHWLETGEGDV